MTMNVVLFGAGGPVGQAIVTELTIRGHAVTGVTRRGHIAIEHPNLTSIAGDAADADAVTKLAEGHDAAISAVGPQQGIDDPELLTRVARSMLAGLPGAGVQRLIVVGGAGSLEVLPGVRLMDTPEFNDAWLPVAQAHAEALEVYRENNTLDWTYISPAAIVQPGERTGNYRIGGDQLLTDEEGDSRISIPDYAMAIVEELEEGTGIRQRLCVAY